MPSFRSLFFSLKKRLSISRLDWRDAQAKGELLLNCGQAAQAIPYFRKALSANPGEPSTGAALDRAREGLAEALRKTGRAQEAQALSAEMTQAEYWWSAVRAGLLLTAFLVGSFLALFYGGEMILLSAFGRKTPPLTASVVRGEPAVIEVRFADSAEVSAGGALLEPAAKTGRAPPWVLRTWDGFENRDAGWREWNGARLKSWETARPGEPGLVYAIGTPDVVKGYGGAAVHLFAGQDVRPGVFRIWLDGAYLRHVRKTRRYDNDAVLSAAGDPLSPTETVPVDAAAGRVPVLEVTVR